jgi:hypothetical protein
MGVLTVGRVGLDVLLNEPSEMAESRSIDSREFILRGFLRSDSVANTKYLRTALLEQQGQVIAVTYTLDSHFNAYYLLADSRIDTMETSYLRRGLFLFEISMFRIGGESRVEFQSNLTGTVLDNDFGITELNTMPFVGLPVGASIFQWDTATSLYSHTRESENGTVPIFINDGSFTPDASWAAVPGTFYDGACELWVGGELASGLDIPNTTTDWVLKNGIIRIQPEVSGTATGRLLIDMWDGVSAYESQKDWAFNDTADGTINNISFISVPRNDPESVRLRLSSEWIGSSVGRHTIDLNLRRGSPLVYVNWNHGVAVSSTMKVVRDTTEAGSTFNAFSSGSTVGVRATGNDAGGNRYVLVCANTHSADTTNGGLSVASADRLKFAVGFEIAGSSAVTHDDAGRVADQYLGNLGERVRAVWR